MTKNDQSPKVDEGYQGLLSAVKKSGMPTIGSVSAKDMRAWQAAIIPMLPPGPEVGGVEDCAIPSAAGAIAARLYRPKSPARALVVFFHGGGWTIGSLDGWDAALRRLVNTAGCAVLSVDYRLAPEHPFPAAVDDALAATRWALANVAVIALGNVPVVVAGDSAGGNLSAVVSRLLAEDGTSPGLAAQILIYPSTDGDIDSPAMQRFESPFLTRGEVAWFFDQYIPDHSQRTDPRFAPLHAPRVNGLPPALVLTAECDLFNEDGLAYAARLQSEGVHTRVRCFEGGIHGFFTMDRGQLPHSGQAMEEIAAFLSEVLAPK